MDARILAIALLIVVGLAISPWIVRLMSRHLKEGDRIQISGGYDSDQPNWLGGRKAIEGYIQDFLTIPGGERAAIVKLAEPLAVDEIISNTLVLHLRSKHARWANKGIVHVELAREGLSQDQILGNDPKNVRHIESHAKYQVLNKD